MAISNFALYELINLMALAVSLYYRIRGYKSLPYLPEFLTLLILLDSVASAYFAMVYKNNFAVYAIVPVLCVSYYLYVLITYFSSRSQSKYMYPGACMWLLYALFMMVKNIADKTLDVTSYNIGMLMTLALILKYLYNVAYKDEFRNVFREGMFYFCMGILIFYATSFPIMVYVEYFVGSGHRQTQGQFYSYLLKLGNTILSTGYLGAALCSRKI